MEFVLYFIGALLIAGVFFIVGYWARKKRASLQVDKAEDRAEKILHEEIGRASCRERV